MPVIFSETFETDGNGTRYTTSIPEFTDSSEDFFLRTDGSNIVGTYNVASPEGSFYFAAQDIDGEGAASLQTITFSGINIAGFTNLNFSALLAEDDASDGNEDWDLSDFVLFEYQIDGGGYNNLLAIENDGTTFNSAPFEDTDFDGTGDGTEITDTFVSFAKAIASTGSTLDLRITLDLDAEDEDLAIDNIQLQGDAPMNFSSPITNPFNLSNVGTFSSPTFVDIDGDGDLDAFVGVAFPGRNQGNTYFYENIGDVNNPDFGTPKLNHFGLSLSTAVPDGNFSSPTFVDIDGDGDRDAFVGAWDGNTYFYQNTGDASNPAFAAPLSNQFGLTDVGTFSTPTFIDFDGDADLDAFVGANDGNTYYYENIGDANNPNFDAPQTNPFNLTDVGSDSNPTFVDADGDGDQDLFVGEYDGDIYYYESTLTASSPEFAAPQTSPFGLTDVGSYNNPTLVDFDSDGDLDAFVGAYDGNALYYENTGTVGSPSFAAPLTNPFGLSDVGFYNSPTLVDFDSDGDLDAFVGAGSGNTLYYQNTGTVGSPNFDAPQANPFGLTDVGFVSNPTLVDFDSDGDLDAFVGERNGNTLYYENTGTVGSPSFAAPQTNPFGLTDVGLFASPTLVDFDSDGDLDAFVGESNGNTYYYENIGTVGSPNFDAPQTNPFKLTDIGGYSNSSLVDIDNDGDLDAFVGASDGNAYYYEGAVSAGSFAFAAPQTNPFNLTDIGFFNSPTFADLNGDGDPDAFVGAQDGNIYLYENAPPGTNNAPTNIALSNTAIYEGVLAETMVGTFSTTDADPGDAFTYELVSGTGDTDNALFTITDNYLTVNVSPDFETQSSYSIRVQTTDQWGGSFEEQFTANINDLEEVNGTPANNMLGGTASDQLSRGLGGNDRIYGVGGNDLLDGGDGMDSLYGGDGNDTLYGGSGNDTFYGDAGNDSILGGAGDDFCFGGNGDDLIDGGAGSDRLYGNGGSDTFVLEEGMGRDFIYSFEDGTDSIQLAGGLTFGELEIAGTTSYTQIKIAETGEFLAMLPGIDVALIDGTDFSTSPL